MSSNLREMLGKTRSTGASLTGDTVYVGAVDDAGNAASLIQSLYFGFGAGVVAEETGIVLQNRGAYFSLDPDHPNRLEPGKRPLHTLIASLAFRDGRLWQVMGCMGADGQPQIHLQVYTALIDFGLDIQRAVEAPRWLAGRFALGDARDLGRAGKIGAGNDIFIGTRLRGLIRRCGRVKPVTKLKTGVPQALLAGDGCDMVYPGAHAVKLVCQDTRIPTALVDDPRHQRGRVCPDGCAHAKAASQCIWHDGRHSPAQLTLFNRQIRQPGL